ncbi:F0F1 ATP synthase subunit gamma [Geminicoccus roseus]|jgi:F-type H+-transporting ATPase subunit gamma|uniref:F0F1 ATP synthase subunit gamma n=1 Tax=Geminicoccus roseus TaxID=404900 RepID=UPI0004093632|nr:F0F1 ATP synthase subunit gamma [Geminicoccus roseus]
MPSLKDQRARISSVKQTRKITSAMKLVAASKLKRAQEQAEASRPYATRMAQMLSNLAVGVAGQPDAPPLLGGTGEDQKYLLIVATADRGLCGGFNSSIARGARRRIQELQGQGKDVRIICVGRKGRDALRRDYGNLILHTYEGVAGKKRMEFADAHAVAERILDMFGAGEFDVCEIVFNKFVSAIRNELTFQQLVPAEIPQVTRTEDEELGAPYEFEPGEEQILTELLPRNLGVQVYRALVENAASEQGARMAAMDSATRNAGDMIKRLTLIYNRTRQAQITKELIEIISGAEAV